MAALSRKTAARGESSRPRAPRARLGLRGAKQVATGAPQTATALRAWCPAPPLSRVCPRP
eukprot:14525822-Alexandrium_andersonii.AAC.1